jgi:uncharacterized membrane protein
MMNRFRRQAIILFALMGFLSAVTVFLATSTSYSPGGEPGSNTSMEENTSFIDNIEIEKSEGDDLFTQSVNGLITLYRDFNTGANLLSDNKERTQDN